MLRGNTCKKNIMRAHTHKKVALGQICFWGSRRLLRLAVSSLFALLLGWGPEFVIGESVRHTNLFLEYDRLIVSVEVVLCKNIEFQHQQMCAQ